MASGCADHRRGRSARGGLADVRPLPDLGPGGPPVAVRRVSATSGHARRRPTRVSAHGRRATPASPRRRLLCLSLARHRGRVAGTEGMPGNQLAIALARQLQWPFSPSSLRFADPWFCKVSQRAMQCHSRNSSTACRFSILLDLFC